MNDNTGTLALPEADVYLFGRGDARRAYLLFGCHELPDPAPSGAVQHRFAVWAPAARSVSLVGDFNAWNTDANPLEQAAAGIWWGSRKTSQTIQCPTATTRTCVLRALS